MNTYILTKYLVEFVNIYEFNQSISLKSEWQHR